MKALAYQADPTYLSPLSQCREEEQQVSPVEWKKNNFGKLIIFIFHFDFPYLQSSGTSNQQNNDNNRFLLVTNCF